MQGNTDVAYCQAASEPVAYRLVLLLSHLLHVNPLSPVPIAVVYNFLVISGNDGLSRALYTSEVWSAGYPAVRTQRVKQGYILSVWLFCLDTLETVWQDRAQCSGLWRLWTYCWSVDRRDLCGWVAAVFRSSYSVCLITCLFVHPIHNYVCVNLLYVWSIAVLLTNNVWEVLSNNINFLAEQCALGGCLLVVWKDD